MRNSLTASERRGVLIVAAIALIVSGIGVLVSLSGANEESLNQTEIISELQTDSIEKSVIRGNQKNKNKKKIKKTPGKTKKVYKRRSPIDEEVTINSLSIGL